MQAVLMILVGILQNKYFWITIAAIIVIIIVKRNWHKIERYFQSADIDYEQGETGLTTARKSELEAIAMYLYDVIYGKHENEPYDMALNTTDQELKYMSKYYRTQITQGTWLYTDIDDETFSLSNDRDVRLMRRLAKIGEKG